MSKRIFSTFIALLFFSMALHAEKKPNILFIFADDMSYETIGAFGMLDIDTPHLDTLVERGTSFTHAYNMETDPMEMNDLSANPEYATKIKELRTDLQALSMPMISPWTPTKRTFPASSNVSQMKHPSSCLPG